jgi:hypothetical protein
MADLILGHDTDGIRLQLIANNLPILVLKKYHLLKPDSGDIKRRRHLARGNYQFFQHFRPLLSDVLFEPELELFRTHGSYTQLPGSVLQTFNSEIVVYCPLVGIDQSLVCHQGFVKVLCGPVSHLWWLFVRVKST